MAKPNSIVDGISKLSAQAEGAKPKADRKAQARRQLLAVSFQDGQTAYLDMTIPRSSVWMDVLHSLRQSGRPAYVEFDPETKVMTELLLPLIVHVGKIDLDTGRDAVLVELVISHARHYLRRTRPDFEQLLETLAKAQKQKTKVLVTETMNDHEIIDVRPMAKPQTRRER